jgi:hypothetical protein
MLMLAVTVAQVALLAQAAQAAATVLQP